MPAAAIGAAVAGAAVTAGIGALTKSSAGGAIQGGANAANGLSQAATAESKALYDGYIKQGDKALTTYSDLNGLNGPEASAAALGKFTSSPGYGFQVSEGLRAVDSGAAARGMLRSGATLKAEQTLGNNLANQDFGKYMERLNGLASTGLNAVTGASNVITGQSNQQQSTLTSAAGAQAGQIDAFGNTVSNALGGAVKNSIYELGKQPTTTSIAGTGGYNGLFDSSVGYGGVKTY